MAVTRNTYSIFAVAMLLLLCSCTKQQRDIEPQDAAPQFLLSTKANAENGTTFRILAFDTTQMNHFNIVSEGTYSMQNKALYGFSYLTASEVDNEGRLIGENPSCALTIPFDQIGDNFFVSYISPAIMHNTTGGFVTDLDNPLYCTDIQKVKLNNYGKVKMESALIDRRAKIGFKFYKDEADKTIEITDLTIIGAGNTYWPALKQVTPTDTQLPVTTLNSVPDNDELQIYECGVTNGNAMPFVLSGIYAPKDTVAAHLQKDANYALEFAPTNLQETGYLMVQFNMFVNGGGPLLVTAPLTYNAAADMALDLNPLTTYMYNITVSETYIKTILEVTPLNSWEDVEFGWEIKDNTEKVYFGEFEFSQWDENPWEDNKDINSSNN